MKKREGKKFEEGKSQETGCRLRSKRQAESRVKRMILEEEGAKSFSK